jgi:hypothetical protein
MKKEDISNKSLATLLIVAIVVSIGGTWLVINKAPGILHITGAPTVDTGTATVTIEASASVRFAVNSLSFGSGKVNTSGGNTDCILDSNGTNASNKCINFTSNFGNLSLENDGSVNVSVQLVADKNASSFFYPTSHLVTSELLRYAIIQNETDSCRNGTGGGGSVPNLPVTQNCSMPPTTASGDASKGNCTVFPDFWTDVNITGAGTTICKNLLYNNTDDSIGIEINFTIPSDAPAGTKTVTFTATATTYP